MSILSCFTLLGSGRIDELKYCYLLAKVVREGFINKSWYLPWRVQGFHLKNITSQDQNNSEVLVPTISPQICKFMNHSAIWQTHCVQSAGAPCPLIFASTQALIRSFHKTPVARQTSQAAGDR